MPLEKSGTKSAISANIREMSKTHSHDQAVAAALHTADMARKQHRALGGPTWEMKQDAKEMFHPGGLINSHVAGRTDHLPLSVPAGAYVVPADVTSGIGQGNSLNGAKILDQMFHMAAPYGTHTGPYGMSKSKPSHTHSTIPHKPNLHFKEGGVPEDAEGGWVPIMAAGGEYVILPEDIKKKFDDLKRGHAILDRWLVNQRKKHIKTLKGLKGPVKQ